MYESIPEVEQNWFPSVNEGELWSGLTHLEVSVCFECLKVLEAVSLLYLVLCGRMCILWIPESLSGKERNGRSSRHCYPEMPFVLKWLCVLTGFPLTEREQTQPAVAPVSPQALQLHQCVQCAETLTLAMSRC